ncbi:MAG: hypothetical protein KDB03_27970, partial [Planctomycetales bacterium]|nr:hypothetical protein [Planctomycetales bacterium]
MRQPNFARAFFESKKVPKRLVINQGDLQLSVLNTNIPRFYCLLRKEFLYDGQSHQGEFLKVCVFGVASIYGRALGFHVLTETGAVVWRLPLHAFCHKEAAPSQPLDWLQFWDC